MIESTAIARTGETNPVRLQVKVTTTTPLASTEEQYWLDSGEQLSDPGKRVFAWTPGSGDPRYYAYDELSNQVSVPGGANFTYNAERNRLLAKDALTYSYDAAGFATSRGGVPITWTAAGRLASYGSATAEWDLSGRLVAARLRRRHPPLRPLRRPDRERRHHRRGRCPRPRRGLPRAALGRPDLPPLRLPRERRLRDRHRWASHPSVPVPTLRH